MVNDKSSINIWTQCPCCADKVAIDFKNIKRHFKTKKHQKYMRMNNIQNAEDFNLEIMSMIEIDDTTYTILKIEYE